MSNLDDFFEQVAETKNSKAKSTVMFTNSQVQYDSNSQVNLTRCILSGMKLRSQC